LFASNVERYQLQPLKSAVTDKLSTTFFANERYPWYLYIFPKNNVNSSVWKRYCTLGLELELRLGLKLGLGLGLAEIRFWSKHVFEEA